MENFNRAVSSLLQTLPGREIQEKRSQNANNWSKVPKTGLNDMCVFLMALQSLKITWQFLDSNF